MTFTHALSTNNYGCAKFIVDGSSAANGTHTTIASAITSASSGDTIFIRPGTYSENLTLKAGVNLTAYECDSSINSTGHVIISGKTTMTTAGSVTISGIQLQTNSDFLLSITGSAASVVNLVNCYLNCLNNTGIQNTSSSASAQINLETCYGNLATSGIAFFSDSSAGATTLSDCNFGNTGSSTTASTKSAGNLYFHQTTFFNPITTSGTGAVNFYRSRIDGIGNTTNVTHGGTGANAGAEFTSFNSGSASAISISAGSVFNINNCLVVSSNTNAITGAGSLNNAGVFFPGSSFKINTTSVTGFNLDVGGISFDGGTTHMDSSAMANANGVLYFDGTQIQNTAVGTATHVLTSNGAGLAPTFQAPSGGGATFSTTYANYNTATNPADATTYYFSINTTAQTASVRTVADVFNSIYIPITGNVIAVAGATGISTLGSGESVTLFVRVNNTTSTNLTTSYTMTATTNPFAFSGLTIAVTAGDFIHVGMTTPTWATNPTQLQFSISVLVQET